MVCYFHHMRKIQIFFSNSNTLFSSISKLNTYKIYYQIKNFHNPLFTNFFFSTLPSKLNQEWKKCIIRQKVDRFWLSWNVRHELRLTARHLERHILMFRIFYDNAGTQKWEKNFSTVSFFNNIFPSVFPLSHYKMLAQYRAWLH